MCLYPRLITNKKYLPTKKNSYRPPTLRDYRVSKVSVGCGNCIECRRQKANQWRCRLLYEIRDHKYNYFMTLTFDDTALNDLSQNGQLDANSTARIAVRRYLERFRKKNKHSHKHWLVTELGHEGTERLHLHGIFMFDTEVKPEEIQALWSYGYIDTGEYVNERSINYIVKYMLKTDEDHKNYKPRVFCSAGIGRNYVDDISRSYHNGMHATRDYMTLGNGKKIAMPIYYRNKFFDEDKREELWVQRIEEYTTYVQGIKITNMDTEEGWNRYLDVLHTEQVHNELQGYGTDAKTWDKHVYMAKLQCLNSKKHKK